jgi:hypothetical protein
VTDRERWQRLGELRAKAVAKQSMAVASTSITNETLPTQMPPSTSFEVGYAAGFGAAQAMQSNADPAPDSNYPMDFTSGYTESFERGNVNGTETVVDGVNWTFDNFSFTQGGPSWDMDFDNDSFLIHGLE